MVRLISAKALLSLKTSFVPVDATWYLPNTGRDGHKEYEEARIPGAVYFDVDGVKSISPFPHMMPSKAQFDSAISELGIKKDDLLVVYDKQGFFSAPRAYWMLEVFGHPSTMLLDNWADYVSLGGKVESGLPPIRTKTSYTSPGAGHWVEFEELRDLVESPKAKDFTLIDARPTNRFTGAAPEPRPEISSGHVPGSVSIPFTEVLSDGHFKSADEIKDLLISRNVPLDSPVIVMCGSGVTACVLKAGIDQVLQKPATVYDGSWSEWAVRAPDLIERDV